MKIQFDEEDLSLEEAEDLEEYTGLGILQLAEALKQGDFRTRMVTGIVWIYGRRQDPEFSLEQARRLKFSELELEVPGGTAAAAAEPAAGDDPGSAPSATSSG